MKTIIQLLMLCLIVSLAGCSEPRVSGVEESREYWIHVNISNNQGPSTISFPLDVNTEREASQTTDQKSNAEPVVTTDMELPLPIGGL